MIITEDRAFISYKGWVEQGGHWTSESLIHLAKSMRTDAKNDKGDGRGRWRPSLIGDQCDRKQLLSYWHYRDRDGNWMAWSGTMLHLAFQAFLLDMWPKHVTIEVPVKPDRRRRQPGVTGKMDWRWTGENGWSGMQEIIGPHIGDYKTISTLKTVAEGPKPMHVQQLLSEMLTTGIHTAYLVYQERSWGNMRAFRLEAETDDLLAMSGKLERLSKHADQNLLPPMLTECRSMKGAYKTCDFADLCMREERLGQQSN